MKPFRFPEEAHMPAAKSPRKAAAAKPLPVALPTEAEVRAIDLELDESAADVASPETEDRETRVRRAAYAAYQRRGEQDGDEVSDWLAAEREVDGDKPSH